MRDIVRSQTGGARRLTFSRKAQFSQSAESMCPRRPTSFLISQFKNSNSTRRLGSDCRVPVTISDQREQWDVGLTTDCHEDPPARPKPDQPHHDLHAAGSI